MFLANRLKRLLNGPEPPPRVDREKWSLFSPSEWETIHNGGLVAHRLAGDRFIIIYVPVDTDWWQAVEKGQTVQVTLRPTNAQNQTETQASA